MGTIQAYEYQKYRALRYVYGTYRYRIMKQSIYTAPRVTNALHEHYTGTGFLTGGIFVADRVYIHS